MFNEKLKKARVEFGMSKAEISKMLNIPYTTYDSYERGKSKPKIEIVLAQLKSRNC